MDETPVLRHAGVLITVMKSVLLHAYVGGCNDLRKCKFRFITKKLCFHDANNMDKLSRHISFWWWRQSPVPLRMALSQPFIPSFPGILALQ
jgi:hypothetical protein